MKISAKSFDWALSRHIEQADSGFGLGHLISEDVALELLVFASLMHTIST